MMDRCVDVFHSLDRLLLLSKLFEGCDVRETEHLAFLIVEFEVGAFDYDRLVGLLFVQTVCHALVFLF